MCLIHLQCCEAQYFSLHSVSVYRIVSCDSLIHTCPYPFRGRMGAFSTHTHGRTASNYKSQRQLHPILSSRKYTCNCYRANFVLCTKSTRTHSPWHCNIAATTSQRRRYCEVGFFLGILFLTFSPYRFSTSVECARRCQCPWHGLPFSVRSQRCRSVCRASRAFSARCRVACSHKHIVPPIQRQCRHNPCWLAALSTLFLSLLAVCFFRVDFILLLAECIFRCCVCYCSIHMIGVCFASAHG